MTAEPMLLHIDGDAFFASVYQATHAHACGKPVVIGRERGIATALSYEAKEFGIRRGMLVSEVKKLCPHALIVTSDYRTYQLFSNKMVAMAQAVSPEVERYSIDEVFLDMTGLDKTYGMTHEEISQALKLRIEKSLGLTVSVGLALTKTLTKIGSNFNKPSGFVHIHENNLQYYLERTPVEDVWGIGYRLAKRMKMLGINTALDFTQQPEALITSKFNKSVLETWYELRGTPMYGLSTGAKTEYKSIRKSHTVTPATKDRKLLLSRVMRHIEKAFVKARRYQYRVRRVHIFLKTQKFTYHSTEIRLPRYVEYPYTIREAVHAAFYQIYKPHELYRATGCTLYDFEKQTHMQQLLFNEGAALEEKLRTIYPLYEDHRIMFGSDLLETKRYFRPKIFGNLALE